MKSTINLIAVILLAAIMASCSGYSKILKSSDRDFMYRKSLEFYNNGKYNKAIQLLEEIAPYYVGTIQEDTVMYYIGDAYFKDQSFSNSEVVLDEFRRKFGRSPFIEEAEYKYAMGFYYSSPDPNRDQTITVKAINSINEYLERYPNSLRKQLCLARITELTNKLYDKELLNAKTYYKTRNYKSAISALKYALAQHPETPHREEILYLTIKSQFELAENSITVLQRDRYLNMMDTYYSFVSEFPDSKQRKEIDRMQESAKKFLAKHTSDDMTDKN